MADLILDDQDTLTEAELDDTIIAIQSGSPKVWRKVTPAELLVLLGVSTEDEADDPGRYFVLPASVSQVNSNKDIVLTIEGVTAYATGQEVDFSTKTGSNGTANARLQINSIGFKKLLKEDGTEFGVNELEPSTQIRAVYNGTDFISDFARRSQVHFIDEEHITRSGDAYTVEDTTIPGTGTSTPIIIILKSTRDNVGDVTLSVNTSTDYSVLLSDGSQMPAGVFAEGRVAVLDFSTVGGIGWHAVNIHPSPTARSLKGTLLATVSIAAGDYEVLQFVAPWILESGVTDISLETLPGGILLGNASDTASAVLAIPSRRISSSQLGWFFEFLNGTTVVAETLINFGSSAAFGGGITTDNDDIVFHVQQFGANVFSTIDRPTLGMAVSEVTMPAGYSVNLYLSEN